MANASRQHEGLMNEPLDGNIRPGGFSLYGDKTGGVPSLAEETLAEAVKMQEISMVVLVVSLKQ